MANTAQTNSRYIYAVDACKAVQSYEYNFGMKDLPRLAEFSVSLTTNVTAKLSFFQNRLYKPFFSVSLKTSIGYPCQRCFADIEHPLVIDRELVILLSDQQDEQNFAPDHEPVWLDEELVLDVVQVIEDEILLAIPSHPLHDEQDCKAKAESEAEVLSIEDTNEVLSKVDDMQEVDASGETTKPFANLKQLLNSKPE